MPRTSIALRSRPHVFEGSEHDLASSGGVFAWPCRFRRRGLTFILRGTLARALAGPGGSLAATGARASGRIGGDKDDDRDGRLPPCPLPVGKRNSCGSRDQRVRIGNQVAGALAASRSRNSRMKFRAASRAGSGCAWRAHRKSAASTPRGQQVAQQPSSAPPAWRGATRRASSAPPSVPRRTEECVYADDEAQRRVRRSTVFGQRTLYERPARQPTITTSNPGWSATAARTKSRPGGVDCGGSRCGGSPRDK
jgi:hypothetical protein